MSHESEQVEHVPVDSLRYHYINNAIYSQDADDPHFLESIKKNGIVPIRAKADGLIISGKRRWEAARKLGWKTVPVQWIEPENDILSLISYNNQRQKTDSEITREFIYSEMEIEKRKEESIARRGVGRKGLNGEQKESKGTTRKAVSKMLSISQSKAHTLLKLAEKEKVKNEVGEIIEVQPNKDLLGKLATGEIATIARADRIRKERVQKTKKAASPLEEKLERVLKEVVDRVESGEDYDTIIAWGVKELMTTCHKFLVRN